MMNDEVRMMNDKINRFIKSRFFASPTLAEPFLVLPVRRIDSSRFTLFVVEFILFDFAIERPFRDAQGLRCVFAFVVVAP